MNKQCDKSFLDNLSGDELSKALKFCSSQYQHIDFSSLYYQNFDTSKVKIFILIFIVIVICFIALKVIADKYLAPVISNICYRFRIPQTLAALTLIAFANGSPDIINALVSSDDKQGADIVLGSLLGAFIFTNTIVLANVIHQAPDEIKLNQFSLKKEIFTYALVLSIVIVFGIFGMINFVLPLLLGIIYLIYLYISIRKSGTFDVHGDGLKHNDLELPQNSFEIRIHSEDKSTYLQKEDEDIQEEKTNKNINDSYYEKFDKEIKVDFINDFLWDKNQNLLVNCLELPINFAAFLSIPHFEFFFEEKIPTVTQKLMLIITVFFASLISLLFLFKVNLFVSLIVSGSLALLILFSILIGIYNLVKLNVSQIFCFVVSISFLQLGAGCILDCLQFISFMTKINKIFLSMIIISSGNSIGDFFGNGAISKIGNSLMGYMACFSGQLFNLLVGLFVYFMFTNVEDFDIFGIHKGFKTKHHLMIFLFATAYFVLTLNIFIASSNYYIIRNQQKKIFITLFSAFSYLNLIQFIK